ncbi:MAG: hypothetical protein R3B96_15245 [Pirellulaceae bacterium]
MGRRGRWLQFAPRATEFHGRFSERLLEEGEDPTLSVDEPGSVTASESDGNEDSAVATTTNDGGTSVAENPLPTPTPGPRLGWQCHCARSIDLASSS